MYIKPSTRKDKRYDAVFHDGTKVSFGAKEAKTYVDSASDKTKAAWIARHKVRGTFNNPKSASSLAKHILWGPTKSVRSNLKSFKRKFSLT